MNQSLADEIIRDIWARYDDVVYLERTNEIVLLAEVSVLLQKNGRRTRWVRIARDGVAGIDMRWSTFVRLRPVLLGFLYDAPFSGLAPRGAGRGATVRISRV